MQTIDRRTFLGSLAGSLLVASAPAFAGPLPFSGMLKEPLRPVVSPDACWLDVAGPFVSADANLGISTQIVLTATCFPGIDGYKDSNNQTAYQIILYDALGHEIPLDNGGRYDLEALHTTLVDIGEISKGKTFWAAPGFARPLPRGRSATRAIFSAPASCAGRRTQILTTFTHIRPHRNRRLGISTTQCLCPP